MRQSALLAVGTIGSLLAHAAALLFLAISVDPATVPSQPNPETQLALDTYQIDRQDARALPTDGETASAQTPSGAALDAGVIARVQLKPQKPPRQAITHSSIQPAALRIQNATGQAVKSNSLDTAAISAVAQLPAIHLDQTAPAIGQAAKSTALEAIAVSAVAQLPTTHLDQTTPAIGQAAKSSTLDTAAISAVTQLSAIHLDQTATATGQAVKSSALETTAIPVVAQFPTLHLVQTAPTPDTVTPQPAVSTALATITAPAAAARATSSAGSRTRPSSSKGDAVLAQAIPAVATKAQLAWEFGDRTVTDPTSLSVIQAFMAPGDLAGSDANAGEVRDGLAATLASVDCARVTATFIPESGALELRGHVPDDSVRGLILAALQTQVGKGITVTDNLLHLPRPQCGALSGIATVGLPQSTDQLTNPLLIGEDAHAREFGFVQGQRLVFDLTAPDYDAVVYVDFFDAAGQVIHLVPNETVPLTLHAAKSTFGVGASSSSQPGLDITIGPPYGQEITVAFASSEPLFDELRPLVEPATPYLEALKSRVAKARAGNSDFKGEWVYFFITTAPATQ